jgi:hypothetical protein
MRLYYIFIAFSVIISSCGSNGEVASPLTSQPSNIKETPMPVFITIIQPTQTPNFEDELVQIPGQTLTIEPTQIPSSPTPINLETFEWDTLPPLSEALLIPSEIDIGGNLDLEFALDGGATVYSRRFDLEDGCSFDCIYSLWETPFKLIKIRMFRLSDRESAKANMRDLYDVFGPAHFDYSDFLYRRFERGDAWMIISADIEFVSARRYGTIVVIVSATPDRRTDDATTEAIAVIELSNEQLRKLEFLGFPP